MDKYVITVNHAEKGDRYVIGLVSPLPWLEPFSRKSLPQAYDLRAYMKNKTDSNYPLLLSARSGMQLLPLFDYITSENVDTFMTFAQEGDMQLTGNNISYEMLMASGRVKYPVAVAAATDKPDDLFVLYVVKQKPIKIGLHWLYSGASLRALMMHETRSKYPLLMAGDTSLFPDYDTIYYANFYKFMKTIQKTDGVPLQLVENHTPYELLRPDEYKLKLSIAYARAIVNVHYGAKQQKLDQLENLLINVKVPLYLIQAFMYEYNDKQRGGILSKAYMRLKEYAKLQDVLPEFKELQVSIS